MIIYNHFPVKTLTGAKARNKIEFYSNQFQNLQSGSRSRQIEVGNHSNSVPISRIDHLDLTQRLGLRGGFEIDSKISMSILLPWIFSGGIF